MPLGKKWRSMEVLNRGSRGMGPLESFLNSRNKSGSRENLRASASQSGSRESLNLDHNHNRHQPSQSRSLRSRLGSLSNNVREEQGSPKLKDSGAAGETPAGYIQRCIIIQRDEKGYGFTVRGDNPVYVEVVKPDGAAAKAGVQQGDRIIKVNGTLVTNSNHLEVVKLIKAGSFVALTLLNRPASGTQSPAGVNLRGLSKEIVSSPQSVNAHKSWELKQSKVLELHKYYELAVEELEKFKKGYQKYPTEKSHAQLLEKEKTVKTLRDQLEVLAGTLPPEYSLPLPISESSPDTASGDATPWVRISWFTSAIYHQLLIVFLFCSGFDKQYFYQYFFIGVPGGEKKMGEIFSGGKRVLIPPLTEKRGEGKNRKYLLKHLDKALQTDSDIKNDREQAVSWALSTFLRYVGYNKHNSSLDKVPSFVCRDRKGIRLSSKPTKRPHRGHNFEPTHYFKVETCMYCKAVIWGVGYQGYFCKNCEQNIHTRCIDKLEDNCKKKDKDKTRPLSNIFKGKGDMRKSVLPEIVLSGQTIKESEVTGSPGPQVTTNFEIQAVKDEEDPDLHQIRSADSVTKLVNQFDKLVPSPADKRRSPGQLSEPEMHRKGTDLGRSESLKGRADGRGERPTRDRQRAKSDLDMDDAIKALHNNSGSSSTSSLSNRSVDSPSNSLDAVNNIPQSVPDEDSDYDVEQELPQLKSVLPEDVYRRLKPKERKRQDVINELIYTERRHVRNLKIMESLFQKPMVQDPNISEEFTKLLFPNLDYMIHLHCSLNNSLKAKRRENKVVDDIGDVLLKRFDNEEGEAFRKNCAIFCRNQQHALDMLRSKQKKDARISTFLGEAESSNLMRRLQLKDLIPTQMMRLTKYPLLIESLKKHTLLGSEEHTRLERALQCSKHILEYVNQAVQDYENIYRLEQLQRRMEKKILSDYMADDLKTLDLRAHRLVHEGALTWNMNQRKSLDVHVILLEDLFVLLQKQDDKLVLKCQSTQLVAGKEDIKYMFAPVLKLNNILHTNSKATDKKAFFVVSKSQIYELSAHTADEQRKWCKYIKDAADAFKDKHIKATVTDVANPQPEVINQERDTLRVENRSTSGSSPSGEFMAEQVELSEEPGLIQPEDMVIKDAVTTKAQPVLTPLDKLQLLDSDIVQKMKDRRVLLKEILKLHEMDSTLPIQLGADTNRPINKLLQDMAQESEDCINMLNSAESGLAKEDLSMPIPMDKLREMANRMNQILTNLLEKTRAYSALTAGQPASSSSSAVVNNRDDERERLRQELKAAQDELNMLREIQRRVSSSSPTDVTLARPTSIISVASTASDVAEDGTLTQIDSTDTDTENAKEDQLEIQTVEPVNAMEMEFPETDTVSTATELPQEMVDIMGENLVGAEPPECESVDDQDPPPLTEEEVNTPSDSQNIEVHRVDEVLADEITEIVEDLIQELPVVESNGDGTGGRRDSLEDYEDASDRLDPEGGAGRESGLEEDMVVSSDRGDNLTENSEKGDNLTESDVEMRDVEGEEVEKRDTEGESDTDNIRTQSDDHILSSTEQCAVDNRQLIDSSCVLDNKTDLDRLTVEGGAALEEMTVDI
ncbi:uncharacterized protein LOC117340584 [Pecten maximus]|uniref:uncharacterized protein LOC117340584 n=1 Tax=Pecten maximus TaxID=6579 RepID=UPI001458E110|nr:uncharacterized protein LOC117340584 [Pecten maximus]